ncbi:hypothetical protein D5085_07600 [Ectothiorhodospiraceae bacterium BW-2]|nr:hypothetical protein D5085_07600 [Ectothiorhodospiraceae bacterium BW-2]
MLNQTLHPQFITTPEGQRISVILPIDEYESLLRNPPVEVEEAEKPVIMGRWDTFFDTKPAFDDDFLADRADSLPQERDF